MRQVMLELEADKTLGDDIRHNKAVILRFAVDIESHLSRIISAYLVCVDAEPQAFLDNALIRASWCTFSVKCDLAMQILEISGLSRRHCTQNWEIITGTNAENDPEAKVTKAEVKALRSKIKTLTRWRNAFAHGMLTFEEGDPPKPILSYFTQTHEQQELNDEFWRTLEKLMNEIADFIVPARMRLEVMAFKRRHG